MLFNSLDFAIFLPLVFAGYWLIGRRHLRAQNLFLLAASYVFYGWWSWKFLGLIALSSAVDYAVGLGLAREERPGRRKAWLVVSLVGNLGLLGVFKYYDFFIANVAQAFTFLGVPWNPQGLHLVLPVGISFYTFQTLSYSIDVYRRKLEPARDPVAFFAYVSFFPQLVAGPIERATNLLPQFSGMRSFDRSQAKDGIRQIIWGLFKKMVIADNAAQVVNLVFAQSGELSGSVLVLGAVFFAFQIYGDFSGYSDIAIGTARLFGFSLMRNFAYPYFSRDIAEFWRRWHISLSTWFRDYLYIPLGGSRGGRWRSVRNTFIIFVVSGFWHGANWTFIVWGALNAIYFLPLFLSSRNRSHLNTAGEGRLLPSLRESAQIAVTFGLTLIAWVFFRADSVRDAVTYLARIPGPGLLRVPEHLTYLPLIGVMVAWEWMRRTRQHALEFTPHPSPARRVARHALTAAVIWSIALWGNTGHEEFIYFQF